MARTPRRKNDPDRGGTQISEIPTDEEIKTASTGTETPATSPAKIETRTTEGTKETKDRETTREVAPLPVLPTIRVTPHEPSKLPPLGVPPVTSIGPSTRRPTKKANKDPEPGQALIEAAILISILETGAITWAKNPEAGLNPIERGIIEPTAQRIMDNLPRHTQAMIGKYSDPVLLIVGLAMWGMRVNGLAKEATKETQETTGEKPKNTKQEKTAPPPSSQNGQVDEPPITNQFPNMDVFRELGSRI